MHIGIVSVISTHSLSPYLHLSGDEPQGAGPSGATAPTLLAEELIKKGHTVSVFSLTTELELGAEYTVRGDNLTIYFVGARKRVRHRASDIYKYERRYLCNKILEIKPSVLNAHWQYEHALAALDSKVPVLVTCRDSPVHVLRYLPNTYRLLRLLIAVYVVNKATYLSVTSNYLAKNIKRLSFNKKISIIPNFEPDWIFSLYKKEKIYSEIPKIVMINNGFQKRKNVEVGIRAFQIIRKQFPSSTLHLYGYHFEMNGPAYDWALSQNLLENIIFHGLVNFKELMNVLWHYNILVHTAREETFGNILAEAMAQGIPVIGGDKSGAVPEVVGENGKAGFLVDINSEEKVAEAVLKIFSNEKVYNQFSKNAREEAIAKFKAADVVTAYEKIYNNLLNGI
ncbi:MAG: glycosyltransferase family 4 protein [Ginsengibacter sp.]